MTINRTLSSADINGSFASTLFDVVFVPQHFALLVRTNTVFTQWDLVFIDRPSDEDVTVREIVEDLNARVGLKPDQIDATEAIDTIGGYLIADETPRSAIENILNLTGYDIVEEGGQLIIKGRGNTPIMTIDSDDMGTADGAESDINRLNRNMSEEAEVPWLLELGFVDVDGDFENNMVYARRADQAVVTRRITSLDYPVALTVDEAATFANQRLAELWRQRQTVSFSLPYVKYALLGATDVITVPDGEDNITVRITKASGYNVLNIEGVIDDPTGANTIVTGEPRIVPFQGFNRRADPKIFIIDSAIPSDQSLNLSGVGLAVRPTPNLRSIGSVDYLFSQDSGATYSTISLTQSEPLVANLGENFSASVSPHYVDRGSKIEVMLFAEPPGNMSLNDAANDTERNVMFIQSGDDWEIVQYLNVEKISDNTYRFSDFLRGRRGTEHLIATHTANDTVVILNDTYFRHGENIAVDDELYYGAASDEFSTPSTIVHTAKAHALRPYSVTNINVARLFNDVNITWDRRTRIGGHLVSGQTIPLSETSEKYDLEIIKDDETIVRTLTALTAPNYLYLLTEQIEDLGAEFIPFTVKIYQFSDEYGRGVPNEYRFENINAMAPINVTQISAETLVTDKGDGRVSQIVIETLVED